MAIRRPLAVIGAGGFGREVAWLLEDINREREMFDFIGFIDDSVKEVVEGYPVIGDIDTWVRDGSRSVLLACAIGDSISRHAVVAKMERAGFGFATLIHPSVKLSRHVAVGEGTIICADNILTTNIKVGRHCILNLDCTVGHDSVLDDCCSLMPGVHISGDVELGRGVYMGTGAVVINRVRVGQWTVVGAGAVVASDLPPGVVAVGVPAKPIKENARVPVEERKPSHSI